MAFIKIKGHIVLFDSDDYDIISGYKWSLKRDKKNNRLYCYTYMGKRSIKMHRLIMSLLDDDRKIVDHINGNGLDNRKLNLRLATCSQNQMNRVIGKKGYKGVSLDERGRYRVRITVNGNVIHGGRHNTLQSALIKYNELAREYHKEFASYNIIE